VGVYEIGFARVPLIIVLHIALVELAGGFIHDSIQGIIFGRRYKSEVLFE
jgi:hypothetical protein